MKNTQIMIYKIEDAKQAQNELEMQQDFLVTLKASLLFNLRRILGLLDYVLIEVAGDWDITKKQICSKTSFG